MEAVLDQYACPYDPLRPLICFDARPGFLIAEGGAILPMSPGKAKREPYAYAKNGAGWGFLAFEPHRGVRSVDVRPRRTAVDEAPVRQNLLEKPSPQGEDSRLVPDNLHTHPPGAFSEVLALEAACALSKRFERPYTPKKGSWVNRLKNFLFPNRFHVYLHDTPSRRLFQERVRAFSSGCIRIEKPLELAAYLLRDDPTWTREKILAVMEKGRERVVHLSEPVPVYLLYWTAWADPDDSIRFRQDLYDWNKALGKALQREIPLSWQVAKMK